MSWPCGVFRREKLCEVEGLGPHVREWFSSRANQTAASKDKRCPDQKEKHRRRLRNDTIDPGGYLRCSQVTAVASVEKRPLVEERQGVTHSVGRWRCQVPARGRFGRG